MAAKSSVSLKDAKIRFKSLLASLDAVDKSNFIEFIAEELILCDDDSNMFIQDPSPDDKSVDDRILDDPVALLNTISNEIKTKVPLNAIMPSEVIMSPETGENSDCLADFTEHVDSFLYNADEVDELVNEGKLKSNFCKDCGSKNIEPLIFISHSLSRDALYHIFSVRLPLLEKKTVLDVGSRLGAVLYGAYAFTDAERIIGVEMNQEFCNLQNEIIQKYKMQNRIEVHHNRIEKVEHLIKAADVIVIHNAFEFYNSMDRQVEIWEFLKREIRKGTILVTSPPLKTTFKNLKPNIVLENWVKTYVSDADESSIDAYNSGLDYTSDSNYSELCDIAFYEVL